jgi:hypothetical protein
MILGSVHSAMPFHVTSLQYGNGHEHNVIFLEIPQNILQKTVEQIFLLDPYTPEFANPLPVENDLIAIEVKTKLDRHVAIPSYNPENVPAGVHECFTECHVVGQSQISYVNSKGGLLTLNTNVDGTGTMSFFPDVGPPGQSGTLLHVKNYAATGNRTDYKPVAIFHGIVTETNQHATPQGVAAILPPFERMTSLPVCDVFGHVCEGVDSPSLILNLADNLTCSVTSATSTHGFAAVKLTDGSSIKYGVLLKATQNIRYAGYKDWAVNAGSGTAAPLSFGRKRSFDETH